MIDILIMKSPDPNHFRTFIAVAEAKNFLSAAEKLGISQAAVSFQLKELESKMPVPLFQLEGKRKVLTHYGRALYEVVRNQENEFAKKMENLNRLYASPHQLTLKVGGRSEVLQFISPRIQFEGKVEFVSLTGPTATEKLLNHEIDVAISAVLPDSTEMAAKKLFQSASVFIVHQKIHKGELTLDGIRDSEFLTQTPSILYQPDGHLIQDWLAPLKLKASDLNVRYIVQDWRSVERLVSEGMGYAIVPGYIESNSSSVLRMDLPASIMKRYQYYAIYEKALRKIPAFQDALNFDAQKK